MEKDNITSRPPEEQVAAWEEAGGKRALWEFFCKVLYPDGEILYGILDANSINFGGGTLAIPTNVTGKKDEAIIKAMAKRNQRLQKESRRFEDMSSRIGKTIGDSWGTYIQFGSHGINYFFDHNGFYFTIDRRLKLDSPEVENGKYAESAIEFAAEIQKALGWKIEPLSLGEIKDLLSL